MKAGLQQAPPGLIVKVGVKFSAKFEETGLL